MFHQTMANGTATDSIRAAYASWAGNYDQLFGPLLGRARRAAIAAVNATPGTQVLEAGVGTGLALPFYSPAKRIIGIDLSAEMLAKARSRAQQLGNVDALLEMDAEATNFADAQFDIAVAMFVASVVPRPRALLAELRRIVKPGGTLLFVNHFARTGGPLGWVERAFAPISKKLGWHADFLPEDIFSPADLAGASMTPMPPLGLFRLVVMKNS